VAAVWQQTLYRDLKQNLSDVAFSTHAENYVWHDDTEFSWPFHGHKICVSFVEPNSIFVSMRRQFWNVMQSQLELSTFTITDLTEFQL